MKISTSQKHVMIIAGETSGDMHGAHLVHEIKKKDSTLRFCGIGGDFLREAGLEILVDAKEISVVGITEVFAKIPTVLKSISIIKKRLQANPPNLLVLIDFPDFNLHIAAFAKKMGIPVLYYVSPQIWAWRSGRIRRIKRDVDHMAVLLPFEKDYYIRHDIPATFVGHPLLDAYAPLDAKTLDPTEKETPVVGLLPGSRVSEIKRNLPYMLAAATHLQQRFRKIKFLLSVAPSIRREWVASFSDPYAKTCRIEMVSGNIRDILKNSTLMIAASGTVTLETAIYGVPMVIMYRISPVSYMLGRALVKVEHIGLVNIIANEQVVPELIQNDASPANIAQTVAALLDHPSERIRMKKKLADVKSRLGEPGAAEKTAAIALSLLKGSESFK